MATCHPEFLDLQSKLPAALFDPGGFQSGSSKILLQSFAHSEKCAPRPRVARDLLAAGADRLAGKHLDPFSRPAPGADQVAVVRTFRFREISDSDDSRALSLNVTEATPGFQLKTSLYNPIFQRMKRNNGQSPF
jgi:hypothetical protein